MLLVELNGFYNHFGTCSATLHVEDYSFLCTCVNKCKLISTVGCDAFVYMLIGFLVMH